MTGQQMAKASATATLTISREQRNVTLTLRSNRPGKGQNPDLSLREN